MFRKIPCKPFEDAVDIESIEAGQRDAHNHVNPYRSLVTSILGQQVSWLAARAIGHRFIRLYFPNLPEKHIPGQPVEDFPTPIQVFETDVTTLRSAGLSQRKAEYLLDLSARFADGRLTAEKLVNSTDEEMREALIAVRGIGQWTCDMFAMFTMRRPNILGAGDLGLQKGLIRWFGWDTPVFLPAKLVQTPRPQPASPSRENSDVFMEPSVSADAPRDSVDPPSDLPDIAVESLQPSASETKEVGQIQADEFPPAPTFPECETLTKEKLRARMQKKIKGNIYLSPKEMEDVSLLF